jgi:hypothetical protein
MKHRFNTEHLVNIHKYHTDLAKQIDEAEWLGNFEHADFLRDEYDRVTVERDRGAVYWPTH